MIFPTRCCISTSLLTRATYSELILRMVTDGYLNLCSHLDFDLITCYEYLGVNDHGDILAYMHPYSYLEPNEWMKYRELKEECYPNVLTKTWLEGYLK